MQDFVIAGAEAAGSRFHLAGPPYYEQLQGRLVAEDKSETMVVPTDLSTTTKPLLTNKTVQGDLLREYERTFANLPDDLRLIRLCSDAGFKKTDAKGQCFVTLDDAELAKLGRSCREYTLPRDDQLSKVKGWIRGNTKIGPVLDVAVSYHQGPLRDRDQNQILILRWVSFMVMIEKGLNKYVTEMSEET